METMAPCNQIIILSRRQNIDNKLLKHSGGEEGILYYKLRYVNDKALVLHCFQLWRNELRGAKRQVCKGSLEEYDRRRGPREASHHLLLSCESIPSRVFSSSVLDSGRLVVLSGFETL